MDISGAKRKREEFLLTLYEIAEGDANRDILTKQIAERIGIDYDNEASKIGRYLREEGLVSWGSFEWIAMTHKGRVEAERIMAETYISKERRVLQKLYDERDRRYTNPHEPHELARDLNLDFREVYDIIEELERKGLIGGTDQASWIIPAGIQFIESEGQQTGGAAHGISFTTNIHGPNYGGIQQGGQGNIQDVRLTNTNNPDFDRAIASVVELIRTSSLDDDEKAELQDEVSKVNRLALKEPAPGLLEKAKSRLDMVKIGLQGTDLLIKATPHLETVWQYLRHKFG